MAEKIEQKDKFKYYQFKRLQDEINRYCINYKKIVEQMDQDEDMNPNLEYLADLISRARYQYNQVMRSELY